MKLRIQSDSIRIRLNKTEVADLASGMPVSQTTSFSPTVQLTTSVETSAEARVVSPRFDTPRIAVVLPVEAVRFWADSAQIALQGQQPIDPQRSLSLLIEKDFECLHHREENQDAFPNPRKQGDHPSL